MSLPPLFVELFRGKWFKSEYVAFEQRSVGNEGEVSRTNPEYIIIVGTQQGVDCRHHNESALHCHFLSTCAEVLMSQRIRSLKSGFGGLTLTDIYFDSSRTALLHSEVWIGVKVMESVPANLDWSALKSWGLGLFLSIVHLGKDGVEPARVITAIIRYEVLLCDLTASCFLEQVCLFVYRRR